MAQNRSPKSSLKTLAKELQAERQGIRQRLASLDRQRLAKKGQDLEGDNTPTSEIMEAVQESVARELTLASRDVMVARLKALDQADAKIREGTYGQCEDCGEPIPEARLRAMPEAVRCVACAEEAAGAT